MHLSAKCVFPHLRKRRDASPKGALCSTARIQSAPFGETHRQNVFSVRSRRESALRVCFSVTPNLQSAPFREGAHAKCVFP